MKKKHKLIPLIMFVFVLSIGAQTKKPATSSLSNAKDSITSKPVPIVQRDTFKYRVDSLLVRIESYLHQNNEMQLDREIYSSIIGRYKLYKTENLYNLLRLDTKTGKIEQVQWSLDKKSTEGTFTINDTDLSWGDSQAGCFELYPTNNMYQFILIDTTNGRMWHVQWGIGDSKRWIRRIY